jgi:LPS O-antigen subunit length determinant protein (WzzB/FepE family)
MRIVYIQLNQMNLLQDDENDLFNLLKTLWDGKWIISAFGAIAVLLGSGFILRKDALYE